MGDPIANDKKLIFSSAHLPNLTVGNYHIHVEQKLTAPEVDGDYAADMDFSVQGERFHIAPNEIDSVFPPSGSLGDFSNVLPHIVINRSTLAWERSPTADKEQKDANPLPWLALLVFNEEELQPQSADPGIRQNAVNGINLKLESELKDLDTLNSAVASFGDLKDNLSGWPGFKIKDDKIDDEYGQSPSDLMSIIFVERTLLQADKLDADDKDEETGMLMPVDLTELSYLAHTRTNSESPTEDKAVIFSKRLPEPGKSTVVHLVSVENRYDSNTKKFKFGDGKYIPLISLKSWRFTSLSAKHDLRGRMLHLNHGALFQINDDGISSILRRLHRPDKLWDAFAGMQQPLSEAAKVVDEGFRIIKKDRATYLLGYAALYNQAGLQIQSLPQPISPSNPPAEMDLRTIIENLKDRKGNYVLQISPETKIIEKEANNYWWIVDGEQTFFVDLEDGQITVHQLLSQYSPSLRLPNVNERLDPFLQQGYVPLPHYIRQGSRTVSWYHGPLATGPNYKISKENDHGVANAEIKGADELLIYQEDTGLFDVSNAAAWELGRLLALKSQSFSVKLDEWKRTHKRMVIQAEQQLLHNHVVGGTGKNADHSILSPEMDNWLNQLLNLKLVPYNYLIPDQKLLPEESIRFFYLNQEWMSSLLHGAFSLGRPLDFDKENTHPIVAKMTNQDEKTGFILNSSIVSGWPGLQIEAFDVAGNKLETFDEKKNKLFPYQLQLAPNMLLFLVEGELHEVDFFLKPEVLHFGFEYQEEEETYLKNFRDSTGVEKSTISKTFQTPAKRVVDINGLLTFLNESSNGEGLGFLTTETPKITPAQFALSMIEGVEKFRWKRTAK